MIPTEIPVERRFVCVDATVVQAARGAIRAHFVQLLTAGSQARELPPEMTAAGQYLTEYQRTQRGIYGTAAAIRVLADGQLSTPERELLPKLIKYLHARPQIERALAKDASEHRAVEAALEFDQTSTVKAADLLYALSYVSPAIPMRDQLIQTLIGSLSLGRIPTGGWSYLLSASGQPTVIATAHVVRALHANRVPLNDSDLGVIQNFISNWDSRAQDAPTACFALLALSRTGAYSDRDLRKSLKKLWVACEPMMHSDAEANYEYVSGRTHYFVREPWQLQLAELACRVSPFRIFLYPLLQQRLMAAAAAACQPMGLRYALSGPYVPTRTNGAFLDVLAGIQERISARRHIQATYRAINALYAIVTSAFLRAGLAVGALAIVALSSVSWYNSSATRWTDLAPNFIAAAVLFFLAAGLRKKA